MVSSNYAWPGHGALANIDSEPFLNAVRKQLDYVALDYYYPAYDQSATLAQLSAGTSWNIPLDPFGMYTALRSMHRAFPELPVLISENGMATPNGKPRPDGVTREESLRDTVYWVQRARQDGVPVIGYLYWSLTDNYEWGSYDARLGLYTVDVRTDPGLRGGPPPRCRSTAPSSAGAGCPPASRRPRSRTRRTARPRGWPRRTAPCATRPPRADGARLEALRLPDIGVVSMSSWPCGQHPQPKPEGRRRRTASQGGERGPTGCAAGPVHPSRAGASPGRGPSPHTARRTDPSAGGERISTGALKVRTSPASRVSMPHADAANPMAIVPVAAGYRPPSRPNGC